MKVLYMRVKVRDQWAYSRSTDRWVTERSWVDHCMKGLRGLINNGQINCHAVIHLRNLFSNLQTIFPSAGLKLREQFLLTVRGTREEKTLWRYFWMCQLILELFHGNWWIFCCNSGWLYSVNTTNLLHSLKHHGQQMHKHTFPPLSCCAVILNRFRGSWLAERCLANISAWLGCTYRPFPAWKNSWISHILRGDATFTARWSWRLYISNSILSQHICILFSYTWIVNV